VKRPLRQRSITSSIVGVVGSKAGRA
jgi:hypothetical protein